MAAQVYTQYSNATNLNNLLSGTNTYQGLQQILSISVDDFYTNFFDIDTALMPGLINWGNIIGLPNTYTIPNYNNVFGFGNVLPPVTQLPFNYPQNFMHGHFYGGQTEVVEFTADEYRVLLKVRYRINTSNFSLNDITDILNIYVQSIDPSYKFRLLTTSLKHLSYQFNFEFTEEQLVFAEILLSGYLLPVPMGVTYDVLFQNGLF